MLQWITYFFTVFGFLGFLMTAGIHASCTSGYGLHDPDPCPAVGNCPCSSGGIFVDSDCEEPAEGYDEGTCENPYKTLSEAQVHTGPGGTIYITGHGFSSLPIDGMENLTISGCDGSGYPSIGSVSIDNSSSITITKITTSDIEIEDSGESGAIQISDVFIDDPTGNAITVSGSKNVSLSGIEFDVFSGEDNRTAIRIDDRSDDVSISDIELMDLSLDYGIIVDQSTNVRISSVTINQTNKAKIGFTNGDSQEYMTNPEDYLEAHRDDGGFVISGGSLSEVFLNEGNKGVGFFAKDSGVSISDSAMNENEAGFVACQDVDRAATEFTFNLNNVSIQDNSNYNMMIGKVKVTGSGNHVGDGIWAPSGLGGILDFGNAADQTTGSFGCTSLTEDILPLL